MKFRPVRGGLETAMKELREINNICDLLLAVLDESVGAKSVFERDIKVEPYGQHAWPDNRIGWAKTYLVTFKGEPVGFTDGPLEEIRK